MKKTFTFLLLLTSFFLLAQVSNEGKPASWKILNKSDVLPIVMPSFDLEELKTEDALDDKLGNKPWRFGKDFSVNYNLNNSGEWTTLENGDRIWRIRFVSEGAKTMNFLFEDFYLPKNGTVYLYSNDRRDLLGAYTHLENNENRSLGSWLVYGSDVWIEYYEPVNAIGQGELKIGKVIHGYRSHSDYDLNKQLNWSGNCNQDVDCPIDSSLEDLKNHNKKGVVLIILGDGSHHCTGSMINNTSNNGVPYILTADHCYSNPANWSFRFNWISPDPVCAQVTNSTNGPTTEVMSGATLRARRANTDFCLLEINNDIPSTWDVVWNGWDRSTNAATKSFGIHHPAGDIMKVCVDLDSPELLNNPNRIAWKVLNWELGTTEGGSSGSPLFDQNGRIIGQLWGGAAGCEWNSTQENGGYDDYGRFNVSWDAGGTTLTQLKDWLDPNNTGAMFVDPYPTMEVFDLDATITILNIDSVVCGNTINPILEIKNVGLNNLTSVTITYQLSSEEPTTIQWTGNLAQGQSDTITLNSFTITGSGTFSASVSNPNNDLDQNDMNNEASVNFDVMTEQYDTNQVEFVLQRDLYGAETTWDFKDSSGNVLYSGGPYNNTASLPSELNLTFNLTAQDCYTLTINDSFGDGICCSEGQGYYRLTLPDNTIITEGSDFGQSATYSFTNITTMSVSQVQDLDTLIGIYPNPSNGIINITNKSGENLKYEVMNMLGQKISEGNSDAIDFQLNLLSNSGVYLIKFTSTSNNSVSTKKVMIR